MHFIRYHIAENYLNSFANVFLSSRALTQKHENDKIVPACQLRTTKIYFVVSYLSAARKKWSQDFLWLTWQRKEGIASRMDGLSEWSFHKFGRNPIYQTICCRIQADTRSTSKTIDVMDATTIHQRFRYEINCCYNSISIGNFYVSVVWWHVHCRFIEHSFMNHDRISVSVNEYWHRWNDNTFRLINSFSFTVPYQKWYILHI